MKTFKEDWLHGEIDIKQPFGTLLYGAVQCSARIYFKHWTDKEVKKCSHDLETLIKIFLKKIGKNASTTNPISIIFELDLLKVYIPNEYEVFFKKWNKKFQTVPPLPYHYFNKNDYAKGKISIRRTYSIPAPHENILAALYILKQASLGNISAVSDMYTVVSMKQRLEIKLLTDPINKSISAAQQVRKNSLTKLLEHILKENLTRSNNSLFKRINNPTPEDKEICRIKSAVFNKKNGFVEFYKTLRSKKPEPPVYYQDFIGRISKIRNDLENKLL